MRIQLFKLAMLSAVGMIPYTVWSQENNYITSKFDFIPGEKVIFFDDFMSGEPGDFPVLWLTNGSGEVVTLSKYPGKWFHLTKEGYFMPEAREEFTENYTIEFDIIPSNSSGYEYVTGIEFMLLSGSLDEPGYGGQPGLAGLKVHPDAEYVSWNNWSEAREWQGESGTVTYIFKPDEKYHISIWVQKQRVRCYANETKILDIPRGLQANYNHNIFRIETSNDGQPLISNFRIAAGLSDMRNRLLKEGKYISYGILFDVNSDRLKPESFATIKAIADIMKEDPTLTLQILGHTDSDGDEVSNLDLSKRRALSVKNELVSKYGCEASRLQSDGKGESEPLAENTSAVGKAKNRRVEFLTVKSVPATGAPSPSLSATEQAMQISSKNVAPLSGKWAIDVQRCFSDDSTDFVAKDVILTIGVNAEQLLLDKAYTNAWSSEKVNESEKYSLVQATISDDGTYITRTTLLWNEGKQAMTVSSVASYKDAIVAHLNDTYSLADNGKTLMVHGHWSYPKTNTVRNVTTVYTKK